MSEENKEIKDDAASEGEVSSSESSQSLTEDTSTSSDTSSTSSINAQGPQSSAKAGFSLLAVIAIILFLVYFARPTLEDLVSNYKKEEQKQKEKEQAGNPETHASESTDSSPSDDKQNDSEDVSSQDPSDKALHSSNYPEILQALLQATKSDTATKESYKIKAVILSKDTKKLLIDHTVHGERLEVILLQDEFGRYTISEGHPDYHKLTIYPEYLEQKQKQQ